MQPMDARQKASKRDCELVWRKEIQRSSIKDSRRRTQTSITSQWRESFLWCVDFSTRWATNASGEVFDPACGRIHRKAYVQPQRKRVKHHPAWNWIV